jgi:hypothetical protein
MIGRGWNRYHNIDVRGLNQVLHPQPRIQRLVQAGPIYGIAEVCAMVAGCVAWREVLF